MLTINVTYGTVEFEQRKVIKDGRLGFESRKIHRDRDGVIVEVGDWEPPLCWIWWPDLAPPEPPKPWWRRVLGL